MFSNDSENVLFLFGGHQDIRSLKAAPSGPPPATIFVRFGQPLSSFQIMDETEGWIALNPFEGRLLAVAMAAVMDLATIENPSDDPIGGAFDMPDGVRSRYLAELAPASADDEQIVPIVGVVRRDLFSEDCTVSLMNIAWDDYRALAERAELRVTSRERFQDRGDGIPVVVISGPTMLTGSVSEKLHRARPLGITFGKTPEGLTMLVGGSDESFELVTTQDESLDLLEWWRAGTTSSEGASALIVANSSHEQLESDRWIPSQVFAVFEFGNQEGHRRVSQA